MRGEQKESENTKSNWMRGKQSGGATKMPDPSKLKAAYDRGWRDGGIAGYNK